MLKGSLVALVTPMDDAGGIDYPALQRLVDFHIDNGSDAIVATGTTGESATLTTDEQIEVIRQTITYANGRLPVIAGTGANSTAEALTLTERAAELDVAACLLVVPYYNKPTQHGLIAHFQYLAQAVDIPQILYNVPSRTALDMSNDTIVELAKIPNIIGLKDATSDIARVTDCRRRCGRDFAIYSGSDDTALALIQAGGDGCISTSANVAPKWMHAMCTAAINGDIDRASEIDAMLTPLHAALFVESNPIPLKWALAKMGYIDGGLRLPLTPLSPQFHAQVTAAMKTARAL